MSGYCNGFGFVFVLKHIVMVFNFIDLSYYLILFKVTGPEIAHLRDETEFWGGKAS